MLKIKKTIFIFIFFLIIFEPPLIPFNVIHIVGIISIIYLAINYDFFYKRKLFTLLVSTLYVSLLLGVYISFSGLFSKNGILYSLTYYYWAFYTIPFAISAYIFVKKNKLNTNWIFIASVYAGIIQSILVIAAVLDENIKNIFVDMLVSYGYGDVVYELETIRLFGLASELTFSTPAVLSMMSIISLFLGFTFRKKFFIFVPILLFSGVVNARNSIIIFMIGILFLTIYILRKKPAKIVYLTVVTLIIMIVFQTLVAPYLKVNFNSTYNWINDGINEIFLFLGGDRNQGYFSYILKKDKYQLPDNILGLLFGKGMYVLNINKYGFNTDIGFINDIWLGGLIYTTFIYTTFLIISGSIIRFNEGNRFIKYIIMIFVISMFALNIKGHVFSKNNFTTLLIVIYISMICGKEIKNENNY